MAIATLQLPSSQALSGGVDWSPLANLGNVYRQAQQEQLRQQTLASLGQGGQVDATTLLRSGDLSLANLGINLQNRQAEDAWRREEAARAQKNADRSYGLQERQAARLEKTPEDTAADRAKVARAYGIDPATPQGKSYILTGQLPDADKSFEGVIENRRAAAQANGLDPSSPGFQSYVLTGKMPREDAQPLTATDKKAILEADEGVMSANTAIAALNKAKEISPKAMGFKGASTIASVGSVFGNQASQDTVDLDNTVTTNALTQLKAIFGGAPTEGERKILLDIQGSSSQPDTVRQKIYDRAIVLANARLKFNEQRANELRGGQFYKPQGITQAQYEALPSGSVFTAPDGTQRVKP